MCFYYFVDLKALPPREPRTKVALACEVLSDRGRILAQLRDLSAGGCRVDCPRTYEAPPLLMISVLVPGHLATIDLPAELRWLGPGTHPEQSALGCRFIHSPHSRREAERLFTELACRPQPSARSGDSTHKLPPVARG